MPVTVRFGGKKKSNKQRCRHLFQRKGKKRQRGKEGGRIIQSRAAGRPWGVAWGGGDGSRKKGHAWSSSSATAAPAPWKVTEGLCQAGSPPV